MSMPTPATRPPRSRFPTRPGRSTGWPTSAALDPPLLLPDDDTPGCTVEACEFRDPNETIHERGAEVWGVSPQGGASKREFREKFGLPFTLLSDEATRSPRPTAPGSRRRTTARRTWAPPGGRSSSTPTGRSPGPGRRSRPRAMPPMSSRPSTRRRRPGAVTVLASPVPGDERGFARGGRRAKPRPQS